MHPMHSDYDGQAKCKMDETDAGSEKPKTPLRGTPEKERRKEHDREVCQVCANKKWKAQTSKSGNLNIKKRRRSENDQEWSLIWE
jgi:hypothetical protein